MSGLWHLTSDWMEIYNMMDSDEAEENADLIFDTLEGIEGEIEYKADGYAKIISMITAGLNAKEKEIERLQESVKRDENHIKRMKESLMKSMELTGKTKFKTDLFSFGIQRNGGLAPLKIKEGFKPEDAPDEFKKTEVVYSFDNKAIRKALEEGKDVSFAQIGERGKSLRIK